MISAEHLFQVSQHTWKTRRSPISKHILPIGLSPSQIKAAQCASSEDFFGFLDGQTPGEAAFFDWAL